MACLYISAPPMINISSLSARGVLAVFIASSSELTTFTPWRIYVLSRVITTFFRFGIGLPMASKVLRPIITGCPDVFSLKYFRSVGILQTRLLFLPSSLFFPMAAMSEIMVLLYHHDPEFFEWVILLFQKGFYRSFDNLALWYL